ncbi:hypothetical protein [Vibrio owensii]|uniref:hypothetical protein n=1 Tax=Vibrio owensii TaxID=696485 RepID=UPI0018F1C1EF|nr:hypothetical protein [Vibrio owensii]
MEATKIVKGIYAKQRIGMLTVQEKGKTKDSAGAYKILCQCDCGNEKEIASSSLRSGKTTSCGCQLQRYHQELASRQGSNFDMTRTYGLIKPISVGGVDKHQNRKIYAQCTGCQTRTYFLAKNLRNNYTRTCGKHSCIQKFHELFPDAPPHPKTSAAA